MKKMLFLAAVLGMSISACLPATTAQPDPVDSGPDFEATAAVLSQQTLDALPTFTVQPSHTPVVVAGTNTEVPSSPTVTATLETTTLTVTSEAVTGTLPLAAASGTVAPTVTATFTIPPTSAIVGTATETAHPIFYGTLPPDLPSGSITIINKSKAEVYISLQCSTPDGHKSILEYPVPKLVKDVVPAGKYVYVVWVGGKKLVGNFSLGKRDDVVITIFKDQVKIK